MVSRMAGSLLHSVGLSELVARNAKEYRGKALDLIKDRAKTRRLKNKLQRYLNTQPPTARQITASLEAQLKQKLALLNPTT
jgi:predicted O-linked N-acetylglucosamine transferase (SPINDLY family)